MSLLWAVLNSAVFSHRRIDRGRGPRNGVSTHVNPCLSEKVDILAYSVFSWTFYLVGLLSCSGDWLITPWQSRESSPSDSSEKPFRVNGSGCDEGSSLLEYSSVGVVCP